MRTTWSDNVMASLDTRAEVVPTGRGDVQLARDGTGPPVLASHGGPGGFDLGLAYSLHLRDGGCEVLAPSRPGYLRTPLESGPSPADQADLYAAMLDALGVERVAILGFSTGGPSAVHFAARHPDRTNALFLDAAIVLPFQPPVSALERATYETRFLVWLSHKMVSSAPKVMTRLMVRSVSTGLSRDQRTAATEWITSDLARLRSLQDQYMSIAPRDLRAPGWRNDQHNEARLSPLPFADVSAPTLIAHGTNDAIVSLEHATHAAERISGAELILVEEGHHLLSASRNYAPVAARQLELAHS